MPMFAMLHGRWPAQSTGTSPPTKTATVSRPRRSARRSTRDRAGDGRPRPLAGSIPGAPLRRARPRRHRCAGHARARLAIDGDAARGGRDHRRRHDHRAGVLARASRRDGQHRAPPRSSRPARAARWRACLAGGGGIAPRRRGSALLAVGVPGPMRMSGVASAVRRRRSWRERRDSTRCSRSPAGPRGRRAQTRSSRRRGARTCSTSSRARTTGTSSARRPGIGEWCGALKAPSRENEAPLACGRTLCGIGQRARPRSRGARERHLARGPLTGRRERRRPGAGPGGAAGHDGARRGDRCGSRRADPGRPPVAARGGAAYPAPDRCWNLDQGTLIVPVYVS